MNKLYTLLSLIFLLGVTASDAQTPTLKAYQKAAKKAIENKDFYSAWKYNSLALRIDSTKMSNMYNLGEAARLFKSYNVARDAYQTVLESDSKADFPLTEFWLARVYHSQSNYDKAITHYQKFVGEQVTPKGPSNGEGEEITQFTALAKQSILDAEWAREQIKQPKTGYLIAPFGNGVNTPATEFAPLEHQNQVYYSALEYDTENFCPDPNGEITRLYTSTDLNSGQPGAINWLKEEKGKFVAHTAFNGDGNRMYFTVCERVNATEFNCEIFYRNKDSNGLWGDASELPEYINREGTTNTHPNVGYDKNTGKELLFFVSNRSDEVGGANGDLNIYCSNIESNGQVDVPVKININTEEDDITPFFNKSENTLYFSSKGHQGYGGFDIFKSERSGNEFAQPVAMDYPLNSSYDDVYFSTDEKFENAYFSSNRIGVAYEEEGMETCCNDIFKLEIIQVSLEAFTFNILEREKGLDSCEVFLYDRATGDLIEKKYNPESNDYYFPLELDRDYMITANRADITADSDRWTKDTKYVSTKGIKESTVLKEELELVPNVALIATTFDNSTQLPLPGCTFEFIDELTGEVILRTENVEDNRFVRALEFDKSYTVVASKSGYFPDEVSFNTNGLVTAKTILESLFLEPDNIALSVRLYFDNDEPDQDTWSKTTKKTYEEAWVAYTQEERIEQFVTKNGKGLSGEDKTKAEERIQLFFDDQVKEGMEDLTLFASFLERYLPQGRIYQIEIEGFASPRAPSRYNKNLTSRRVSSVENYLRTYNDGILAPYIGQDKNLRIKLIPRGEDPSEGLGIPSKISDPKSIYSVEASEQRKVEIVRVKRIDVEGQGLSSSSVDGPSVTVGGLSEQNDGTFGNNNTAVNTAEAGLKLELIATSFDRKSRSELTGVTFRFIDESTGAVILETERLEDNRFNSLLQANKRYRLVASKSGYTSDEITFSTYGANFSKTYTYMLYLEPSMRGVELPVTLYFDNDEPDKKTRATTTRKTYEETYRTYVLDNRVQTFISENGKGLTGDSKRQAQNETRVFFDGRVREGMNRLELLAQFLERNLPQGNKYQIELEGFASPRAPSEYNQKLTSRRVSSVENYLREYNGGVLAPYIGYDKSLRIMLVPRGEETSAGMGIPSQYSDPKSIFSIEASEQRRVSIVRIKSF